MEERWPPYLPRERQIRPEICTPGYHTHTEYQGTILSLLDKDLTYFSASKHLLLNEQDKVRLVLQSKFQND